jgi:dynein assembly factor 3
VDLDDLDALLASAEPPSGSLAAGGSAAKNAAASQFPPEDLHVLLIGAGDVRHVLQTICKLRRRKPKGRVHLYLYEPNLRLHCRHLVLLQVLFDRLTLDELEDRTSVFLEIFGNTLIRDITAMHLKAATERALKLLGYNKGYLADFFDFSEMKMKERDFVEQQLKHWANDASTANLEKQWDSRVRTEMAERYDSRTNIIDWDFHMNLMEYSHLIKYPEYREWRLTGQAFDYARINPRRGFKYDYTVPNKSLAHFDRAGRGLYQGDVKYGPFFALGCDTENANLTQRGVDGTVKYGNGVIAMHNVRAWLYELATQKEWPFEEHKFAWDDAAFYNHLPPDAPKQTELDPEMPNVLIHIVGLEFERFLLHMGETSPAPRKFDAAFVSCGCANFLAKPLLSAMCDDGVVVCETIKYVLDAVDEAKDGFIGKLNSQAAACGWSHRPTLTAHLHARQPPPKTHATEPTTTQLRADQRCMKPHQVAYAKDGSSVRRI